VPHPNSHTLTNLYGDSVSDLHTDSDSDEYSVPNPDPI
jgi:hypothetical protein